MQVSSTGSWNEKETMNNCSQTFRRWAHQTLHCQWTSRSLLLGVESRFSELQHKVVMSSQVLINVKQWANECSKGSEPVNCWCTCGRQGQSHENIDRAVDQACSYWPTLFCTVTLKPSPHWRARIYSCIFPFDCRLPSITLDTWRHVFVSVFDLPRMCKSSVKKIKLDKDQIWHLFHAPLSLFHTSANSKWEIGGRHHFLGC